VVRVWLEGVGMETLAGVEVTLGWFLGYIGWCGTICSPVPGVPIATTEAASSDRLYCPQL
jgi:hypothetical protein